MRSFLGFPELIRWNWITEPRELRSDFRPDEIVVTDWFTCIIGASVQPRIL